MARNNDKWASYQNRSASQQSRPAARKGYDPDSCPSGYDEDVWDLALRFRQHAERGQVELAAPLPVIYGLLLHRIEDSGIKNRKLLSFDGEVMPWQQSVRAMISYYADKNYFSEHEADLFCNPLTFRDTFQSLKNISLAKRIEAGLVPLKYPPEKPEHVGPDGSRRHKRAKA